MNINCDARSYIIQHQNGEELLKYVATVIEQQLKEWNKNYQVMVMKFKNYKIMVNKGEQYYHVNLSENELESFFHNGSYQLDRKVWRELENQGLPLISGTGDYIDFILSH